MQMLHSNLHGFGPFVADGEQRREGVSAFVMEVFLVLAASEAVSEYIYSRRMVELALKMLP
jgi:hypothetical protein